MNRLRHGGVPGARHFTNEKDVLEQFAVQISNPGSNYLSCTFCVLDSSRRVVDLSSVSTTRLLPSRRAWTRWTDTMTSSSSSPWTRPGRPRRERITRLLDAPDLAGLDALNVDCRSAQCRVELAVVTSDSNALNEGLLRFAARAGARFSGVLVRPLVDGDQRLVVYVERQREAARES